MTALAPVSTPHMAPRCTPLCWLLCSPKVVYQFKGLASCLTCLGTRLQLTLGTVWHFLRGTFEHSCTSMSAHLSLGTSSHSCRGTSLQSSLELVWGKMVLIYSPWNLPTSLSWNQAALLPLHLLTLFSETTLGQGLENIPWN